jgi:hypothetical protein
MGLLKQLMIFRKSGLHEASNAGDSSSPGHSAAAVQRVCVCLLLQDLLQSCARVGGGATGVPLFTIWDSVAGPGRTPIFLLWKDVLLIPRAWYPKAQAEV